jgi:hypothetical protein
MTVRAKQSQIFQAIIAIVAIDVIKMQRQWFATPFLQSTETAFVLQYFFTQEATF